MSIDVRPELANVQARLSRTLDEVRVEAAAKRHAEGYRTARENLADLLDAGDHFGKDNTRAAVVVYDYAVLAGTQGFYHHKKLDRIFELAEECELQVVM
jgi:acetyl-CoA carboxylase carboxyltransferase component